MRTMGNINYIGELINKKLLPFKVFYLGVSLLITDYLTKFREVNHLKITPASKNYEVDLECLIQFLERVGNYARIRI